MRRAKRALNRERGCAKGLGGWSEVVTGLRSHQGQLERPAAPENFAFSPQTITGLFVRMRRDLFSACYIRCMSEDAAVYVANMHHHELVAVRTLKNTDALADIHGFRLRHPYFPC